MCSHLNGLLIILGVDINFSQTKTSSSRMHTLIIIICLLLITRWHDNNIVMESYPVKWRFPTPSMTLFSVFPTGSTDVFSPNIMIAFYFYKIAEKVLCLLRYLMFIKSLEFVFLCDSTINLIRIINQISTNKIGN